MVNRQFRQDDFNKYDPIARKNAKILILSIYGKVAVDHENQYGVDLAIYDSEDNLTGYCEVEVRDRMHWKDNRLRYPSLHIPARKYKYVKDSEKTLVITFKDNYRVAYLTPAKYIIQCPVTQEYNKAEKCNEDFYDVPLEKVPRAVLVPNKGWVKSS